MHVRNIRISWSDDHFARLRSLNEQLADYSDEQLAEAFAVAGLAVGLDSERLIGFAESWLAEG